MEDWGLAPRTIHNFSSGGSKCLFLFPWVPIRHTVHIGRCRQHTRTHFLKERIWWTLPKPLWWMPAYPTYCSQQNKAAFQNKHVGSYLFMKLVMGWYRWSLPLPKFWDKKWFGFWNIYIYIMRYLGEFGPSLNIIRFHIYLINIPPKKYYTVLIQYIN